MLRACLGRELPDQARFECIECGFTENADLVGAIGRVTRPYILDCGLSELKGGVRPDGLWIEPHGWSEAGTHLAA